MKIALVTEDFFEPAAQVYARSWRESHRDVCSPAFLESRDCAAYLRTGMERGKRLFLLWDPEPVGLIAVMGREIGDLYVLPEQQGRGYGSKLLEYAMPLAEQPFLTVLSSNNGAIRLYERYGFRETGRKELRRNLWELTLEKQL